MFSVQILVGFRVEIQEFIFRSSLSGVHSQKLTIKGQLSP